MCVSALKAMLGEVQDRSSGLCRVATRTRGLQADHERKNARTWTFIVINQSRQLQNLRSLLQHPFKRYFFDNVQCI
jgi:hypothetical protein